MNLHIGMSVLMAVAWAQPALPATITDLGTLGGAAGEAFGINDAGQVVGWALTTEGYTHAFLYSAGTMSDLGALSGGNLSEATAINAGGQIVG